MFVGKDNFVRKHQGKDGSKRSKRGGPICRFLFLFCFVLFFVFFFSGGGGFVGLFVCFFNGVTTVDVLTASNNNVEPYILLYLFRKQRNSITITRIYKFYHFSALKYHVILIFFFPHQS